MSTLAHNPVDTRDSLADLCGAFPDYHCEAEAVREVDAADMPEPYRRLLVHKRHMTLALSEHFGVAPNLYVMAERRNGSKYVRKIFLTAGNRSDSIELGVVRMDLDCLREDVADQILQRRLPLGEILTRHEVMRRIEPRSFLLFPRCSSVLGWFGHPRAGPFYGRLGTIYCNEHPAIDVLEIVTLWEHMA